MNMSDNANAPATPFQMMAGAPGDHYAGLSKREHFAAIAMHAIISSDSYFDAVSERAENDGESVASVVKSTSYAYADEMLGDSKETHQ